MLSAIGFVLFIVAGICELVKSHLDLVIWLVIIGGALVAADVAWGWRNRRWPRA
jgi:O-antigen/teichoic acid export membrane protein